MGDIADMMIDGEMSDDGEYIGELPDEKSTQNKTIVKVQTPLATNEPTAMALIYSEDKSIKMFIPITKELLKLMDNKPKAFFYFESGLIKGKAEWQVW